MTPVRKIFLAVASVAVLSVVACKEKDYTCRCDGGFTGQGQTKVISKTTKPKARKECMSMEQPAGTADGYTNCRVD